MAWDWGGGHAVSLQAQPTGLLPCPQLRAWTASVPRPAGHCSQSLVVPSLSGRSWPGPSQALIGLFRSEERVRAERGRGEGTRGKGQGVLSGQGPPGAAALLLPQPPTRAHACRPRDTSPFWGLMTPFQPKLYLILYASTSVWESPTS